MQACVSSQGRHGHGAAALRSLLTCPRGWALISAAGDWLQGPYVYALYQHYGYDVKVSSAGWVGGGLGARTVMRTALPSAPLPSARPLPPPSLATAPPCHRLFAAPLHSSLQRPSA
jgi:hypothetical protein